MKLAHLWVHFLALKRLLKNNFQTINFLLGGAGIPAPFFYLLLRTAIDFIFFITLCFSTFATISF